MRKTFLSQILFITIIVALVSSFNIYAQKTQVDVYKGKYSNQIVPQGQNIPTPHQGDFLLLYDNGPMITHPGGGFGGADASALQTALTMGTYGFGQQVLSGNTIADEVFINSEVWTIDNIQLYGYQTGSTTTSTINDVRLQIWQNHPNGGGTVVWGDLTTNVLTSTNWTNIYRTLDTDLLSTARPIMEVNVAISPPLVLPPGEYWLQWGMDGTLASGPWQPPVTIVGSTTTGNALNSVWSPLVDVGPQGAPFLVFGTPGPAVGPGLASNPNPPNLATGVEIPNQTLSWTNPVGATTNEVYFGTNPASLSLIHTGSLATSVPVAGLVYSTQYFWRVDEIDGSGTTTGVLWSFTTEDPPCPILSLPVLADFEDGLFPPNCWTQNGVIWTNFTGPGVGGYGNSLWSAVADFYGTPSGFDDLVSIEYTSVGATTPLLTFDWAYAIYPGATDHLELYYSTDSGVTWVLLADMYNGAPGDDELNPFGLSTTSPYFPLPTEWSTRSIPLPANTTNVSFTAVTDYGNLLWIDNIQITGELFLDSFENPPYAFPGFVAAQNPTNWTTWSGPPYTNEDAPISQTYASDGIQSALIDFVAPRDVDLVYLTGTKTSGKWYMSFDMYIPEGQAGYFNTQATYQVDWGMEVYFNLAGVGELDNGTSVPFTWVEDNWNKCLVIVDLNTSTAEFWFGPATMTQIATWDWTRGGTIPNTLDGYDFFGATTDDEMYIDNFRFSDLAPPILQLADDAGTLTIDVDPQVAPGTVVPQATVKNYGTATNSFDVVMNITGGYTSTKTVTALAGGDEVQVTFDNWTAVTGAYSVDVTTQLVGDQDPLNDSKAQPLYVWDESGTWSAGTDYPITTYNGVGVPYNDGVDNFLFVMGGNAPIGDECYKYNVTTDTWTQVASLPQTRLIHAGAVVGDYIYVIGGSDGAAYTTTNYRYDIVGDSWTTMAPVPTTIGWCRAVGYDGNYIYLAGGYDGVAPPYLSSVYLYNVTTDTWSSATSMPLGIFGGGFALTGNTLVYATGALESGISDVVMVGTINLADPSLITWVVADNTFPGNGNTVREKYGADLLAEIDHPTIGAISNHSPEGTNYPAGAIYRNHAHTWGSDAIIIAGGTPTASYIAAEPGPCYVYKPATDTWIAQENIPVTVGAHQSGSFNDGSTWKFIIASGFGVDSTESETQIYTQTLGGTSFALTVTVTDGWNMVSVPGVNPAGQGVDMWWSGKDPGASVFKYSGGYSAVTTTTPTEGYWMKNVGPQVYSYPAIQIVPHTDVPLALGWNLIGLYDNTVPTPLTTSPPGIITTTIFEYSGGYLPATNLVPGYGYWVKSDVAGGSIVSLTPPPVGKGSVEAAELFDEDWGKIIITDNAGISYTLYAVNGEVDLNQYELPPLPPAGMFDIRFGSGRIAEDFNSSDQTIEMSSLEYPITVSVEGMDIRVQDESGKEIDENVKSGDQITISNTQINKLMVSGELIPDVFALEQNYPNPFNPTTTIKFSVAEATDVTLTIYNTLGQKVTELVNSKLEAGRYSYQWDASDIASGMYIYELRANKFVSVKKMIFLK